MKMRWCMVLLSIGAICISLAQAAPQIVNYIPITLGTVYGKVEHERLIVKQVLANPFLLKVKQQDIAKPMNSIFINHAILLNHNEEDVQLKLFEQGKSEEITTVITLSVWLDGEHIPVHAQHQETGVVIYVPKTFRSLDVRVEGPVEVQLPRAYRGDFALSIDMDCRS